jgi:hypothetical protein
MSRKQSLTIVIGVLVLFWAMVFAAFRHEPKVAAKNPPVSDDLYSVLEYHRGFYDVKQMAPMPATYVIKHGNVIIHAECAVLIRREGYFDPCTSFPDPAVPVGEPLHMQEVLGGALDYYYPDFFSKHGGVAEKRDGVSFRILSEKAL